MQPNINQTPLQAGSTGLQPSTYYEYPSATPPTPPKAKSGLASTIMAIVFGITSVALITFIIFDKVLPKNQTEEPTAVASVSTSTPLSSVDAANYAAALPGRIFTIDGNFEQTIKFTSATEYEYSYYANPETDVAKFDLSIKRGTYTIANDEISLDSGDSFLIKSDYLVKKTDKVSNNKSTVYFDSYQISTVYAKITKAFKTKLASWGGDTSYNASKAYLDHLTCSTDSKRLTNADNYICHTDFDLYFDESGITTLLQDEKVTNFLALCNSYAGLKYYGGTCNANNSISTNRNLVVRIANNTDYSITGVWTDAEAVVEEPAEEPAEESTDDSAETK